MRVAAAALALTAVVCLGVVIAAMAAGTDTGPRGWVLRVVAVVSFAAAVALNVLGR
jgi:hypothetical protein